MRRVFNPPVRDPSTSRSRTPHTFISLPSRTNSQIGETEAPAALLSFLPCPVDERSFWSVRVEQGSDGAAVDDPGLRGGGGGGGGCAGHAPGAPRRAGPDRRAHVLVPAAPLHRDTLRRLPAPRCVRRLLPETPRPSACDPVSGSDFFFSPDVVQISTGRRSTG